LKHIVRAAVALAIITGTTLFAHWVRSDNVGLIAGLFFGPVFVYGSWAGLGQ
jgi:hypothetical protein